MIIVQTNGRAIHADSWLVPRNRKQVEESQSRGMLGPRQGPKVVQSVTYEFRGHRELWAMF